MKPMLDYAAAAGLKTLPTVLDTLTYYTPDEGYQTLAVLGDQGRDAYRWTNYADFVIPVLFFLSVSLPNVAMGKDSRYIVAPLIYMISDYLENIAQKFVLEIYPKRNDFVMTAACYAGMVKMVTLTGSMLVLIIDGLLWKCRPGNQLKQKTK